MGVIGGRVVLTADKQHPYKVVLQYEGDAGESEHPVSTMREGEKLINDRLPAPVAPNVMREGAPFLIPPRPDQ
jgi:hypothetical protein